MKYLKFAVDNLSRLASTGYPGRGIIMGRTADSTKLAIVYWVTGRSENSRNRIFVEEQDCIKTEAFDVSKMTDPSLIIYRAMRWEGSLNIVSNGDQTDTIYHQIFSGKEQGAGKKSFTENYLLDFESALMTRCFEPDTPNYTPRISGIADAADPMGGYSLSILSTQDGISERCVRTFYRYKEAVAGCGHCIHTYREPDALYEKLNINNEGERGLPSFMGEPYLLPVPDKAEEAATVYWQLLDERYRVALAARYVDFRTGKAETAFRMRHKTCP